MRVSAGVALRLEPDGIAPRLLQSAPLPPHLSIQHTVPDCGGDFCSLPARLGESGWRDNREVSLRQQTCARFARSRHYIQTGQPCAMLGAIRPFAIASAL